MCGRESATCKGGTMTTSMSEEKRRLLAAYTEVRDKGTRWLLQFMNPDGSLGNPAEGFYFYRAPWTFTQVGATDAATAICGWIRRHMLTPEGDFTGPYRVSRDAYGYRNATLIVGAHKAGQYDLSLGALPWLLRWQDPQSGGIPDDLLEGNTPSDNMDIPYTCGAGFAFLATGQLERARSIFAFLQRIYDVQPALPDTFYYAWSRSRQTIITEFPPEERFWYIVENQLPSRQRWTIGGIAAGFLCRLYLADPQPEYLALARQYQDFSMRATDGQFDFPQVCKSSWGSSLLYQITGEQRYAAWTYRMGDWYAATQQADGRWQFDPDATLGSVIELTLEFVMHVDTLIGALAARPSNAEERPA